MARIPEEEIERIKREVSVQQLAEARGIKLKRHGKDLLGLCPFHADTEPSFVVSPDKNQWNCLGACQRGGTPIDFVMVDENVDFREAADRLRMRLGLFDPSRDKPSKPRSRTGTSAQPKPSSPVGEPGDDDATLLASVVAHYHERLKQTPHAMAYLSSRGLGDDELIDTFQLGFADRSLGYRLPARNRAAGEQMRSRLQKLGVLRDSGYEHLCGCVVFPIVDTADKVVQLYGRRVATAQRGASKHLYLPRPHRGVLNAAALSASKELILCESVIDTLTFWTLGFRNVTAAYGINGFTDEHLQTIKRCDIERVLVAYDSDAAGDKAARQLATKINNAGVSCARVVFPYGTDANDVVAKGSEKQAAKEKMGELIAAAVPMTDGTAEPDSCAASTDKHAPVEPCASSPAPASSSLVASQPPETSGSSTPEASLPAASEPPPCEPSGGAPTAVAPPSTPTPPSAPAASQSLQAEIKDEEVVLTLGDRRWRIRGLERNLSVHQMKVNVFLSRGELFHLDTFDLYSARHRQAFQKVAGKELELKEEVIKSDFGRVLFKLEELQRSIIKQTLTPQKPQVELNDAEREAALELLRDPKLLERILDDFAACGVVGEESNKLVAYLAATSRKLERPLAVVVQSSSAAGKTELMDAVLAFMAEEEKLRYSAMTDQSLYYLGEKDLKHKILAIMEEKGAERAAYPLKLLQSEGELMIASTGKDPKTGRLVTQQYRVEGPVMIMLTTTAIEVDEELLNRCLVLSVNEDRSQTQAIHRQQRQNHTLDGIRGRPHRCATEALHQNAQRLIRPLWVVNPYAEQLTFAADRTRMRRDQQKYLTLIDAIALLHQYQREIKVERCAGQTIEYIEVTVEDIAVANRLAAQVMGRSLDDLPPQTRRFLEALYEMVSERCAAEQIEQPFYRFTRRQVREQTGWSYEQVRVHLGRLVELEYVIAHRGGRGQSFVYELAYDGQGSDGAPHLPGLIDVGVLSDAVTTTLGGSEQSLGGAKGNLGGGYRVHTGAIPVGSRTCESDLTQRDKTASGKPWGVVSKTQFPGAKKSEVINASGVHASGIDASAPGQPSQGRIMRPVVEAS